MAAPHSFPDLEEAKRAARERALAVRAGYGPARRAAAATALAAHMLLECPPPPGAVVSGVWPLGDEFDLHPLMQALHARGHPVALPVTPPKGQALAFGRWRPGDALVHEPFGTMRPIGEEMVPDFLLVPLLAFDRNLHRLGYGAGYYDRTLAALRTAPTSISRSPSESPFLGRFALGYGFASQEVDVVPVGPHDVALDAIATEHGVIRRKKG